MLEGSAVAVLPDALYGKHTTHAEKANGTSVQSGTEPLCNSAWRFHLGCREASAPSSKRGRLVVTLHQPLFKVLHLCLVLNFILDPLIFKVLPLAFQLAC